MAGSCNYIQYIQDFKKSGVESYPLFPTPSLFAFFCFWLSHFPSIVFLPLPPLPPNLVFCPSPLLLSPSFSLLKLITSKYLWPQRI